MKTDFSPRIVTYGRLSQEFYDYVTVEHPEFEIYLANSKEELTESLRTFNCYAGFNALNGLELSNLRWIHAFGAGVDSFLENPTVQNSEILISRSYGKMGELIGEYCLAHILNTYQNIPQYLSQQKQYLWKQLASSSLRGRKVMVLGTGSIGSGVAEILQRFGCEVIGVSRSGKATKGFQNVMTFNSIKTVASQIDVCINCLPLTEETEGVIDSGFLKNFHGIIFINVGRGKTVQSEEVLLNALSSGNLSKVILDVFTEEPLSEDSKLWSHSDITITPHVSGISTIEDVKIGFEDALAALYKQDMDFFVDHQLGY